MESVLGRYRNLTILVGILFLQVLGLAVQVKRSSENESSRLIRIWAVNAVTPFEKGIVWAQHSSSNLWHNYFYLRGVRQENRDLKQKIQQMEIEQVRLSEDANQARRLQALLGFKEQFIAKTVAAQVIGSSGSEQSRVGLHRQRCERRVEAGHGRDHRRRRRRQDLARISEHVAGAAGQRPDQRRGRDSGKVAAAGSIARHAAGEIVLEKVMSDEPVQPGDRVLTSGGDQIFPKGLPVGNRHQDASLHPARSFFSTFA